MKHVKLIIFDVDGTLTDGGIYFGPDGEEHKRFNILDGLGFRLAESAGLRVAIISGRDSKSTAARMKALGVTESLQGVDNKLAAVNGLREKYGLSLDEVAFVGDDINDLPAFDGVSVRIAVQNASQHVKARATYVTTATGGNGAAREAIEAILAAQGRLNSAVEAFLDMLQGSHGIVTKQ
ncbi:MAG TPA: HAD hydrolase family protein [Capsulimonadaceae bacterium]|jgi:3-deoxy-D-manno-octulosonate 8-phosphate phosphatase (KDO 8-P phosphatase)